MDDDGVANLVRAAASGDAAAWKELYQQHSGLVWAVARAYLTHDDAHDVCQTIWLRLAENLTRLREPAKVGAWLARATRNEALLVLKQNRRTSSFGDLEFVSLEVTEETPESVMIEAEEAAADLDRAELLWSAFQELAEGCQRLLRILIASPRPSYREIAEGLGIAVGSIGPNRARCLRKLGALLAQRGIQGFPEFG
ncbi:RNA polymerase sigma factor [Acrocarpospora phusangensis]|uniref:RNA polymerase sigma factor n=1 Tax=Acrocarpospora phusangensis TaxID=1070424 RepID=A0A919UP62_9ACTN|nr:sigma-70 family RNA polymerase sigma factor [Acrocarpospora phusangensis]GIH25038.1 RNA polymerase sigma factor [Acrocarpospora phusangensis]